MTPCAAIALHRRDRKKSVARMCFEDYHSRREVTNWSRLRMNASSALHKAVKVKTSLMDISCDIIVVLFEKSKLKVISKIVRQLCVLSYARRVAVIINNPVITISDVTERF